MPPIGTIELFPRNARLRSSSKEPREPATTSQKPSLKGLRWTSAKATMNPFGAGCRIFASNVCREQACQGGSIQRKSDDKLLFQDRKRFYDRYLLLRRCPALANGHGNMHSMANFQREGLPM